MANNPLNMVDPSGEAGQWALCFGGPVGCAAAVVITGGLVIGAAIYTTQRNQELIAAHNSSYRPPPRRDGRHWSTNEPDLEPPNGPELPDPESSTAALLLSAQLIADEVISGHAEKHIVQGEWTGLGIRTTDQLHQHIENVVLNPSSTHYYSDGRVAFTHDATGTVVVRNGSTGESTAFRPPSSRAYEDYVRNSLPRRQQPYD